MDSKGIWSRVAQRSICTIRRGAYDYIVIGNVVCDQPTFWWTFRTSWIKFLCLAKIQGLGLFPPNNWLLTKCLCPTIDGLVYFFSTKWFFAPFATLNFVALIVWCSLVLFLLLLLDFLSPIFLYSHHHNKHFSSNLPCCKVVATITHHFQDL